MKYTKKLLAALVMALALALCALPMLAYAEDGDPAADDPPAADEPSAEASAFDTPLTVTGLAEGDTVKFYQVIEWVGEAQDNVAGWRALSAYSSVLDKDTLTAVLVGDPSATPPKAATGITSELAGQLAKIATGGVDGTVSGTTATLENAAAGMWMALVTPADADTVYNPVFVSADYDTTAGGTIGMNASYPDAVAKSSTLTLTKTASTTEDTWDDNKPNTTAVGDTVNFTVNTAIPGYGDVYEHPHFALTDKLTALALNTESVTVTAPANLVKGTHYTVEATAAGYTITFAEAYLKTVKTATDVTVTYSAIVTSDAEFAVNEEDNEVYIEYSHNPNDQSDYNVKKDTTQHYTFTLDASGVGSGEQASQHGKETSELVKIGVDAAGNPITEKKTTSTIEDEEKETLEGPLAGAVFGLFTDSAGTTPLKDKDGNDVTATTGEDGRMTFAGLDAGTYYLKEISAPAGYVTDSKVYTVEIAATFDTVKVTEWWNGTEWVSEKPTSGTAKEVTYDTEILKSYTVTVDGQPTATYTFTNAATATSTEINWETAELVEHPFPFTNTKGTELPSTGGMGTTILYIIGGIMVLLAAVFLITKRRVATMKKESEIQ